MRDYALGWLSDLVHTLTCGATALVWPLARYQAEASAITQGPELAQE